MPDATDDPSPTNPLVADGVVGSYAGVPLVSHTGHALGTLGVIDRRARPFEPETIDGWRSWPGRSRRCSTTYTATSSASTNTPSATIGSTPSTRSWADHLDY